MSFSFPKSSRLRSQRQFHEVAKWGHKTLGRFIIVTSSNRRDCLHPKLGITVTRRFGKAIKRNRFKRLVREAFRLSAHQLPPHLLINVSPRSFASDATFEEIQSELVALLKPKDAVLSGCSQS